MTDLVKPCPFCGSEAAFRSSISTDIGCTKCSMGIRTFSSRERAVAWWNQAADRIEALKDGITSAQLHTSETLRLLQWDQLGWDVPEEVIESLGKADSELRALLEEN